MDVKQWLKHKDLSYRDGVLYYGETNLQEVVQDFKMPLYVVNEDLLRQRYQALHGALENHYNSFRIHYAVKANSNLTVLKILAQEGAYFDVVSEGEVFLCLEAGIPADHILFTGNNWSDSGMRFALEKGVMLNLDAISHIKRLAAICEAEGYEKPVLSFRVNPSFGGGHHDHCITAGKDIKFGIFEPQVLEAYQIALDHGFSKFGIHMHIGSGILEKGPFVKAMTKYFEIIEAVRNELNINFEFIDFGGGLGIPYRKEDSPLPLDEYASTLMTMFKEKIKALGLGTPIFAIEPGRYLTAEAGLLLTQVNTYKDTGFKVFVGVDGGFTALIRPAFYGSHHEIIPVVQDPERPEIVADIVGQICESGDVLGKMRTLPKPEEKEYLAILDAGAYGFAMASNYNSHPKPAEILISRKNPPVVIREREVFEDLLRNQSIPDRLQ